MREKTCAADLVAMARLEPGRESAFSEDGTAIFTVREFSVTEVLRASSLAHVKALDEISVSMLGGTLVVNGRKVTVTVVHVAELHDDSSYLLFLKAIPGSDNFESFPQSLYDLSGGELVSLTHSRAVASTLSEARREIETAVALCPAGERVGGLAY